MAQFYERSHTPMFSRHKNTNRSAWAMVISFLTFVCLLSYVSVVGGLFPNYSNGYRVGTVQKTAEKGLLCTTTEGELVLDSFKSRTNMDGGYTASNYWQFSALDATVRAELNKHAGSRVKLTYNQYFIKPWCGFTDYIVTKVEPVP